MQVRTSINTFAGMREKYHFSASDDCSYFAQRALKRQKWNSQATETTKLIRGLCYQFTPFVRVHSVSLGMF